MSLAIVSALLLLATPTVAAGEEKARTIELSVTEKGFEPSKVTVKKGEPLHLVVTRKTEQTCATSIDIKDAGIKKDLPLNTAVAIDFTPQKSGEVRYACGMGMLGGVILVQ
jgi:plastocyanin domain-containing protein